MNWGEWEHKGEEDSTDMVVHSMVVGGVLCRWWGDKEPEGVETLKQAKRALQRENLKASFSVDGDRFRFKGR